MSDPTGKVPDVLKPAKRSFFSKPSWATSESLVETNQDTAEIFGRASNSFAEIVADKERKRQAKLAKKQDPSSDHKNISRREKRRRISQDKDSDNGSAGTLTSSPVERKSGVSSERPPLQKNIKSTLPETATTPSKSLRTNRPNHSKPPNQDDEVIVLDESVDEILPLSGNNIVSKQLSLSDKDIESERDQDDDPMFRELEEKARERRRLRTIQATPSLAYTSLGSSLSQAPFSVSGAPNSRLHLEGVIKILITSPIPNTQPLIVARKLSQRLQEVRVAWCKKQNFSDDMINSVFLAYRNKRLFDVTTCKSLGISIDERGNMFLRDQGDILGDENFDKIHLEVFTEELFLERKRGVERGSPKESQIHQEITEVNSPPMEEKIRLYLRARGLDEFRLEVRNNTTISRIANAFRIKRGIPKEKHIFLMFDGDRLEPDITVEAAEIANEDVIEVHIK